MSLLRSVFAVAAVWACLWVCVAVCEEEDENEYGELCGGAYKCRSISFPKYRRARRPSNVSVAVVDEFDRFYFTATRSGPACTLSGAMIFASAEPYCYSPVNLYTEYSNQHAYGYYADTSHVTFYNDGFSIRLYVSICDIGSYENPCECEPDFAYDECNCGVDREYECFPAERYFVSEMVSACENQFDNYSSGTCD
jgi:hypothetical protein